MNERIQELAEKAGFLNKDEESIGYFAELIVSECVMLCDKVYEHNDNVKIQAGATFCREDIKEHFGVEE